MQFPANPFGATVEEKPEVEAETENKTPWKTVEVGESWLVPDYSDRRPYLAATVYGRRTGKKFSCRREGFGMRITRIDNRQPKAAKEVETLTYERDVRPNLLAFGGYFGREAVIALLAFHGVKHGTQLLPSQYKSVLAYIEKYKSGHANRQEPQAK